MIEYSLAGVITLLLVIIAAMFWQCRRPSLVKPTGKHPIGCVGIFVIDAEGRILVGRRIKKTTVEGVPELCIPGGKIDWMEPSTTAAEREVLEETGLIVKVTRFVHYSDDIWPELGIHCLTVFFEAEVVGGDLTVTEPDKFDQLRWMHPEEIDHLFAEAQLILPMLSCAKH